MDKKCELFNISFCLTACVLLLLSLLSVECINVNRNIGLNIETGASQFRENWSRDYQRIRDEEHGNQNDVSKEVRNGFLSRHLSQTEDQADDENDDAVCELTATERRRFYNEDSQQWIMNDEALQAIDSDIQRVVNCTEPDDVVLFQTTNIIRPRQTITIPWNLTLSTALNGSLINNGRIVETESKAKFTCPETGDLLFIRTNSVTIANIEFRDCSQSGSAIVLNPHCETLQISGQSRFFYVEFQSLTLANDQWILNVPDQVSCTDLVVENSRFIRNQCLGAGCLKLARNSTLLDLWVVRNQGADSLALDQAFFRFPTGSHITASSIRASNNCIRVFHISQSNFSLLSSIFEFNRAENGSSLWFGDYSIGTVSNCSFINNTVSQNGGSVFVFNRTNITIQNSLFLNGTATVGGALHVEECCMLTILSTNITQTSAMIRGGGIGARNSTLELNNTHIVSCHAGMNGGGIEAWNVTLNLHNSTFSQNTASTRAGGGIYAFDGGQLLGRNLLFRENRANFGGGLSGDYVNLMELENVEFVRNSANTSGGFSALSAGTVRLQSISVTKNTADTNGGAVLSGVSNQSSLRDCNFTRNQGSGTVGGLALYGSVVDFTDGVIEGNSAGYAGHGGLGISAANITLQRIQVISNHANGTCGGICVDRDSRVVMQDVSASFNSGGGPGGGGMEIGARSSLLCRNCSFESNVQTLSGGGLYASNLYTLPIVAQIEDSVFRNNSAVFNGGGIYFAGSYNRSHNCSTPGLTCSRIVLLNTELIDNFAGSLGAAVFTGDPASVLVSCSPRRNRTFAFLDEAELATLDTLSFESMCRSWRGNQVSNNSAGREINTRGWHLSFSADNNSGMQLVGEIQSGFRMENVSSGQPFSNITIIVSDAYGSGPVSPRDELTELRMSSPDGLFPGFVTEDITNGTGSFPAIAGFKPPGNYTLEITSAEDMFEPVTIIVSVRECRVGEEPTTSGELCQECDAVSYNFNVTLRGGCTACPEDGTCEGRYIIPKEGYWHKGPCYHRVQECLLDEACAYKNRQTNISEFTADFTDCSISHSELLEYGDILCDEGYQGPLCGSCKEDYGLSRGFKCIECLHKIGSVVVILFFVLYLMGLASFTIRGSLPIHSNVADLHMLNSIQTEEVLNQTNTPAIPYEVVQMIGDGHIPSEEQPQVERPAPPTAPHQQTMKKSSDLEMTRWKTTEILKIMINFLQVTAIAATINIGWTEGVDTMFQISDVAGAISADAISQPIDCIISSSSAAVRSIWRTLLSISVPVTVMGVFSVVWGVITFRQNKDVSYFWKRTILSINAVTYISYVGLTKLAVRVFYCVDVYNADDLFSDSQNTFWAIDTAIECYKRDHVGLVVIAIVVLAVVTIAFPLLSAIILSRNKTQHREAGSKTMETMGFLYRAFKEKFVFWESIVMIRKAFLSVIVVFSYPLGGQIQGAMAAIVLFSSQSVHLICCPFREEFHSLNYCESASLLVSGITLLFGQFFEADKTSGSTKVLLATLIITINTAFFVFLLCALFLSGINHIRAVLQSKGYPISDETPWWTVLKVYMAYVFSKCTKEED